MRYALLHWLSSSANRMTVQSMAGSTILSVTYGIKVLPKEDPFITIAERALNTLNACANPGSYMGKSRATLLSFLC